MAFNFLYGRGVLLFRLILFFGIVRQKIFFSVMSVIFWGEYVNLEELYSVMVDMPHIVLVTISTKIPT